MVDNAIRKAAVLIEALGWIRQFQNRYVVIKLGGSTLENKEAINSFLTDVIFMSTVGMKPILVHGGGKAISQAMADAGIEPRFVQGRRYTDEATLDIATQMLAGEINPTLVKEIEHQQGNARGLHYLTENCLIGEKIIMTDNNDENIDLGFVGQIVDINQSLIEKTCEAGEIPVIPSVALDKEGQKLNVNADTAAAAVARLLKAEKLVFLSDVPGICSDKDNPESLISHLDASQCKKMIEDGTIAAGMVPKVDASLEALRAGVGKVHIVDAMMPHSILLEIYSDKGVGTEIVLKH